ncbi:MAG: hypothetical protein R2940_16910 [Syntrophotaleaceae bacterium]
MIDKGSLSLQLKCSAAALFRRLAGLLLIPLLPAVAAALTVTATPPSANIVPEANSSVPVFYRAFQLDSPPFQATSPAGRFETGEGTLLGTWNRSLTINLVNNQGSSTENIIVPARVMTAALELGQSRIFFRRTFTPSIVDLLPADSEVELQIVPSSAGQFSLVNMLLEFTNPPGQDPTRPSSGGRITVPRNSRGLGAVATLTYNGGGTLRGQWKVDGQVLAHVTRYLPAGKRDIALASPTTPVFPTYAGGLHRVEFEVLEPLTGFDEPVIFYYVAEAPPGPPLGTLELLDPPNLTRVELSSEDLPTFSWQSAGDDVIYHLQLYGLESGMTPQELSREDFSGRKPLLASMTRENSYTLSIFDVGRIVPGMPYVWQVQAYRGQTGIGASHYRQIFFHPPQTQPDEEKAMPVLEAPTQ